MGVHVCGCVGVWVCGCVGVHVCGCACVWVCMCVGVHMSMKYRLMNFNDTFIECTRLSIFDKNYKRQLVHCSL